MIRPATVADMPRLLELGHRFHAQSGVPFKFDDEAVTRLVEGLLESDAATVLISEHGLIGGMLSPAYCDPQWLMAVELFWWADRDGLALLRAFEAWAAGVGAQEVRMTSLAALPRADGILKRKGYAPMEISYQKVI